MNDNTKIAGKKTVRDWKEIKIKLQEDFENVEIWEEAYKDFLQKRITSRYLEPIRAINGISKYLGKGFSIVSICCSLIEFFHTLKLGYDFNHPNYSDSTNTLVRSTRNQHDNGTFKPLRNKEIFIDFLTMSLPFSNSFNEQLADEFYTKVRCGMLHQAETKDNWIIVDGKSETSMLNQNQQTDIIKLFRRPFEKGFAQYMENYKAELISSDATKRAFIFKFNKICQIN